MTPQVRLDIDGGAATITIDRPEVRNAIGLHTVAELSGAIASAQAVPEVQVLVLQGAGDRVFVSGGDLRELAAIRDESAAAAMARAMRRVLDDVADFPCPTVAALNGVVLGGGAEVACAADIRVAADDVEIGFTQVDLAIIPAWGGIERLTRLVGRSQALLLTGTGRRIDASTALSIGLVDLVLPRAAFTQGVRALAQRFADLPPGAAAALKSIVASAAPPEHPAAREHAVQAFAKLWAADEHWIAVEQVAQRRRALRENAAASPETPIRTR